MFWRWRRKQEPIKEVTKQFIFFGYMEKQDELIRAWLGWELWVVVILCISSLVCASESSGWAIWGWLLLYVLVTFTISAFSVCRVGHFYHLSKKSNKIVAKHKDPYLKQIFNRSPKYLKIIICMDLFFPILWFFSFLVKLLFVINAQKMKDIMSTDQTA